ncbi:MAG: LysR substrate-binding domain-containing protein [Gammaproteobacteria bacterium]
MSRLTDSPSGSLHVTVEADFALAHIAPILAQFLDRYPEVQVRFSVYAPTCTT